MYYGYQPGSNYYPLADTGTRYYQGYRQFPPVDTNLLCQSASESKKLMAEAAIVLNKLSASKVFASELMYAAQASDFDEVNRLIYSIGLTSDVDVYFNPEGFRLEFKSESSSLKIVLRWR